MAIFSDCARAATAEEARFRVPYANSRPRKTRIIALDDGAAERLEDIARAHWHGAHFLRHLGDWPMSPDFEDLHIDAELVDTDGNRRRLSDELEGADAVVVLVSGGAPGDGAALVGNSCMVRGIMTTGLVTTDDPDAAAVETTVNALRPYMRMLVVASGNDYITEMLHALRA